MMVSIYLNNFKIGYIYVIQIDVNRCMYIGNNNIYSNMACYLNVKFKLWKIEAE